MNWLTRAYYLIQRWWKAIRLYLIIAGPGLVVMIADTDAGGITTYAATGAKYQYCQIWFLLLLIPVADYVQEMNTPVTTARPRLTGETPGSPRQSVPARNERYAG